MLGLQPMGVRWKKEGAAEARAGRWQGPAVRCLLGTFVWKV